MLMTISNGSCETSKPTPALIAKLKASDEVVTYSECGWFCAAGFTGGRKVVAMHFDSEDDYRAAMGGRGRSIPWPPR